MKTYVVKFSVDGRMGEITIRAYSRSDAEKLVKAQYPSSRVVIMNITLIG